MGRFVISKRKDGEFQFNLKADNGQTILSSEGYTAKSGAVNGIESVKKHSTDDINYEKKTSANEKHYFNLKASNGQVIGVSEMYDGSSRRDNGIDSVKNNASKATTEDQTV